jgi:hypothetical protein
MTICRSEQGTGVATAAPVSIIAAAADRARRGWRVFPLRAHTKVPIGGSNGCLGASSDPTAIALWPGNDVNFGIATGRGLVVLDVDDPDGFDSLAELERRFEALPETASVRTPSGGAHFYFSTRAQIRCSAGRLGAGLDVRGEGGYVVAVPSVLADGRYEWDNHPDDVPLAPLPGWLERLLTEQSSAKARPVSEWRQLAADGVGEGERNAAVARLAGHLLARDVDPHVVLELVRSWNQTRNRPPLPDNEVGRTVESIAALELRKRKGGA